MECEELFGVVGPPFVAFARDERAVRGVGALIKDFFGVSFNCLLRLPARLDDDSVLVVDAKTFERRPAVTNGCLMAA